MLIICATISMITNFVGLKYVSAMKAALIMNLMPIFISILGVLCLKEIIKRNEIIWIIGAFIGVLMMISSKTDNKSIQISYYFELFSSFLIVISWFLASVWFLYIRVFNQSNSPLISPFYYALILFILSVAFLIFYPSVYNFNDYTFRDISLFFISGIWNSAGNTLSSYASKLEEVSTLAPFGYIGSVFAFTWDLFIFRYSFGIVEIIGALLVISFLFLKIKIVEQSKKDTSTRNQDDNSRTWSKN